MADHLVSMKTTKKEKDMLEPSVGSHSERPVYPYGLEISLNEESIEKLGLSSLPQVGTEGTIFAKVKVTRVSETEDERNGKTIKRKNLELQITDLSVDTQAAKNTAHALFGGKE